MIRAATLLVGAAMLAPATLAAQTAAPSTTAAPTVGATVYDTSGAPIGTISSIASGAATIDTGTHKVPVPLTSIGPGAKGAVMAMTQAQLNAAYEQASAQAGAQMRAKLVPGTAVSSLNGSATVGTIKSADAQYVTLTTAKGAEVKLPVSGFSTNAQGNVIVGMTAEQFNAAVSGATAPAGGTAGTTPPSG